MPEPPPRGLDKTVVVAMVLIDHGPLCGDCISAECGLPADDIAPTISRFEQKIAVNRDMGLCPECGRWTQVYWLVRKVQK
jgi:hypothetical protein